MAKKPWECSDCGTPVCYYSIRCRECNVKTRRAKKTRAVYKITHIPSSLEYVGSTEWAEKRWRSHQSKMRMHTHENALIRALALEGGPECFSFEILETVPEVIGLKDREQYWIDTLGCVHPRGLNRDPDARVPGRGREVFPEYRAKMSETVRGRKHSDESKAKISAANLGKRNGRGSYYCGVLTEMDVFRILLMAANGMPKTEMARVWEVSTATIGRVVSRKTWGEVEIPLCLTIRLPNYLKEWRGRQAKGVSRKLSKEDVAEIRRIGRARSRVDVAAQFGVTPALISAILVRRVWKNV